MSRLLRIWDHFDKIEWTPKKVFGWETYQPLADAGIVEIKVFKHYVGMRLTTPLGRQLLDYYRYRYSGYLMRTHGAILSMKTGKIIFANGKRVTA